MSARYRLLKAVSSLNSRYIFGRVPLLNVLVLAVQVAMTERLGSNFDQHFDSKPILTMMVVNSILNGIADTVAQTIATVRKRGVRKPRAPSKKDGVTIEIHDLNEKGSLPSHHELHAASSPYDFERLVRFMAWGLLMAPLQFQWFAVLSEWFPITEKSQTAPALWRVALDQIIFSPIGLAMFFVYMTVAEGGGKKAITRKFDSLFVSALKSNYLVWPAVQMLNFRIIPLQFQLPFASTIGIAWNTYLSLANEAVDTQPL